MNVVSNVCQSIFVLNVWGKRWERKLVCGHEWIKLLVFNALAIFKNWWPITWRMSNQLIVFVCCLRVYKRVSCGRWFISAHFACSVGPHRSAVIRHFHTRGKCFGISVSTREVSILHSHKEHGRGLFSNYVTCMLQKCFSHLKDCEFVVLKEHTHKERCANTALCVHVFKFQVDNMTSFPSRRVTMPSLSRLFISHILWPAASSTKKSQTLNLSHVSVCVSGHVLILASEEIFMHLCVFSVSGYRDIQQSHSNEGMTATL